MNFLKQLGFSGRFQALRLGFIVNETKISPCVYEMIKELLAKDIDFMILDIKKIYRIDAGYFDLIIVDHLVQEIYEFIDQWIFLIVGKGLLLSIIENTNKVNHPALPLIFRGTVQISLNPDKTCQGFIYQNDN